MLAAFVAAALFSSGGVRAQGPGRGISKSTWAVSDRSVVAAYNWMMKYLPVECANDSCANNVCTCGKTARVALKISNEDSANASTSVGISPGFGIHAVLSEGKNNAREDANGGISVQDLEDIWDEQLKDMLAGGSYSPWADFSLALWTSDGIGTYSSQFDADKVPYTVGSWTWSGKTYYSLVVKIPQTQLVFEIQSDTLGDGITQDAVRTNLFSKNEARAYFQGTGTSPSVSEGLMTPVQVSRATSSADDIITFYKSVFGKSPVNNQTLSDGTRIVDYKMSSQATVMIRFVERPGQTGKHTTNWLETFLNSVNKEYMTSYTSCWPVYGDNHYCIDSQEMDMDAIKAAYDKNGYKYHLFSMPFGNGGNGYFADPTGWQIQLDGRWSNFPSDAGSFSPNYCMTSCSSSR